MEWWHRGSPRHKNSEFKNMLQNFLPRFFRIKTAFPSLVILKKAKLSTRNITHFCWCNWRTFWRKNAAVGSLSVSCSCATMPRLTGQLQPRRNWPTWVSSVLITHPSLPISPIRKVICSLDWKSKWKVATFRPTRKSLLLRTPGWMDKFLIFFWVDYLS
jgi:hypothetical protein